MDLKNILPEDGPPLSEVKKYIEKYKNDLIVIKYGGNVLIDRDVFNNFITDLYVLNKLGISTIVVHGGGPRIKRELEKSNIQSKFIRGLRVTDKNIINIVESVLIDFNDDIVENLNKKGSKGVSIHTKNSNVIGVIPEAEELGFVGIPTSVNNEIIFNILEQNKVPIVSPLGLDKNSQTYNINGDTAAGAMASSLLADRLLLLTDVIGVKDADENLIHQLTIEEARRLIDVGIINSGMIPKVNTSIKAIEEGVRASVIIDGRVDHACLLELFTSHGIGTLFKKAFD